MNVFILNTGRCGSVAITKACNHITNFTAGHETRSGLIGDEHFDYPENYIEADNRLSWFLGRLDIAYGDNAVYVHLLRNEHAVAQSFTRRYWNGIIKAYRGQGILRKVPDKTEPYEVALDYCHTVNSNVECFLKDKSKKMTINIEDIKTEFPKFWELIGAEGDLDAAIVEFDKMHNSSKKRILPEGISKVLKKLQRIIVKFPNYLKTI